MNGEKACYDDMLISDVWSCFISLFEIWIELDVMWLIWMLMFGMSTMLWIWVITNRFLCHECIAIMISLVGFVGYKKMGIEQSIQEWLVLKEAMAYENHQRSKVK